MRVATDPIFQSDLGCELLMASTLYATPTDLADRFDLPDTSFERAWQLLEDVERRLAARVPDLAARIVDGRTSLANVRLVVVEAALRVLRNPSGFRSETTGDYSYQVNEQVASGLVLFPADDLLLLGIRSGRRQVGSMQMTVPSWRQL